MVVVNEEERVRMLRRTMGEIFHSPRRTFLLCVQKVLLTENAEEPSTNSQWRVGVL